MSDYKLLINGELRAGDVTMPIINPATEQLLAECPRASEAQLNQAVAAAKAAFPSWSNTPIEVRKAALSQIADVVEAHAEEIGKLLVQEQGKPLADAIGEVHGFAIFCRYFCSLDLPIEVMEDSDVRRVEAHRKPLGVVGAMVPWNFPLVLMAFKLPPALIAGNTLVIKPAPTTPLSTLRIAELIKDLLPPGVLNVITDANDLGAALTAHPDIRKISFTGSTATGAKVMAGAASLLKRITLELGGNDAAIVMADADPKELAPLLYGNAFHNAGQVCIALKRLYIHDSLYEPLCTELAKLAKDAIVGDGLVEGTQMGPLQNRSQYEKVKQLIEESKTEGTLISGEEPIAGPGFFIRPTLVRDIKDGARLVDEEQFGPVLPLIRYTDYDAVVATINRSPYGLGASVWGKDKDAIYALAQQLDAGTVWVNKVSELDPAIPFGGAKQSGLGNELGEAGLAEFTQLKIINIAK